MLSSSESKVYLFLNSQDRDKKAERRESGEFRPQFFSSFIFCCHPVYVYGEQNWSTTANSEHQKEVIYKGKSCARIMPPIQKVYQKQTLCQQQTLCIHIIKADSGVFILTYSCPQGSWKASHLSRWKASGGLVLQSQLGLCLHDPWAPSPSFLPGFEGLPTHTSADPREPPPASFNTTDEECPGAGYL